MKQIKSAEQRTAALQGLMASTRTLLLSTASPDGEPEQSYAPFVRDAEGCFYIFISTLARHTRDLMVNPRASTMIIRSEAESRNLFARERAVFQCSARKIEPDEAVFSSTLEAFEKQFGDVVSMLRSLPDFHLFALIPGSGRYVAGFGQAFSIDIQNNAVAVQVKP